MLPQNSKSDSLLGVDVTLLANAAHIFTDLGTLGEDYQHGAAINNTSQIAGSVGNRDVNKPETSCVEFFTLSLGNFSGEWLSAAPQTINIL